MGTTGSNLIVVQVHFKAGALDFGGQLSLSSSQMRLISKVSGSNSPAIAYPVSWEQETHEDSFQLFKFDDVSHYASSISARKDADLTLVFEVPHSFVPRFLQIRGSRLKLPTIDTVLLTEADTTRYRGKQLTSDDILDNRPVMGYPIDPLVRITPRLGRLTLSTNGLPSSITVEDNFFVSVEHQQRPCLLKI